VSTPVEIAPAKGKLGILLVGLGAVSTTTIAGVFAIRKGLAKPIGSLAEMGTIRLGKRTDGRSPLIRELVPLATLDDIVFGGWDIFADNCYEAAKHAGVLEDKLLDQVKDELAAVTPMSAVFDRQYAKRLSILKSAGCVPEEVELLRKADRLESELSAAPDAVRQDALRPLLADERLSVKDVAVQMSFSSEFYFSHFFRHHTGMTPSEFRQHLKG